MPYLDRLFNRKILIRLNIFLTYYCYDNNFDILSKINRPVWYLFKFYDSISILEVVNLIENNEKLKKHLFRNMHTAIIWVELQFWVNTALITGQRFQWSFDITCTKHTAKSTQIILLYIILCRKVDFIKSTDWQYVIRSSVMKTRNWTFHETRFVPCQQLLWQI